MIISGTSDHFTFTDAIKMSEALIQAGKSHEFVVLPEQTHEYDKVHDGYFWRKVGDFFHRALPARPPSGLDPLAVRAGEYIQPVTVNALTAKVLPPPYGASMPYSTSRMPLSDDGT